MKTNTPLNVIVGVLLGALSLESLPAEEMSQEMVIVSALADKAPKSEFHSPPGTNDQSGLSGTYAGSIFVGGTRSDCIVELKVPPAGTKISGTITAKHMAPQPSSVITLTGGQLGGGEQEDIYLEVGPITAEFVIWNHEGKEVSGLILADCFLAKQAKKK